MSLNIQDYTLENALLGNNCIAHRKAATESNRHNRTVHRIIAIVEFLPIIGQITSLGEWALFRLSSDADQNLIIVRADRNLIKFCEAINNSSRQGRSILQASTLQGTGSVTFCL